MVERSFIVEINVESVVNDIKNEIEGIESDIPTFSDVMSIIAPEVVDIDGNEIHSLVGAYNANCYLIESTPIKGNRIIVFIKRIIRKFTRFYIRPLVDSQNDINAMTGRVFSAFEKNLCDSGLIDNFNELFEKNAILELKLKAFDKELDSLKNRINALELENKSLKEQLK